MTRQPATDEFIELAPRAIDVLDAVGRDFNRLVTTLPFDSPEQLMASGAAWTALATSQRIQKLSDLPSSVPDDPFASRRPDLPRLVADLRAASATPAVSPDQLRVLIGVETLLGEVQRFEQHAG